MKYAPLFILRFLLCKPRCAQKFSGKEAGVKNK